MRNYIKYECNKCSKEFKSKSRTPYCPKCLGKDISIIKGGMGK